jgi:hypothetical protein
VNRRSFLAAGALASGAALGAPAQESRPSDLDRWLATAPAGDFAGWTERARLTVDGEPVSVMENLAAPDGSLAFVTANGRALVLGKRLEPVAGRPVAPYLGLDLKTVSLAGPDLLADRLLASGEDPDPDQVRDAAPPPASRFDPKDIGPRLPWTFFLGARRQADTMPVTAKGSTRTYRVDQVFAALTTDSDLVARRHEGLLGGDAPAILKVFPLADGRYYEVLAFGDTDAPDREIVQTWHRTSLVEAGRATKVVYGHSYPAFGDVRTPPEPAAFYDALLRFILAWRGELEDMAGLTTPDDSWRDMTRHAFVKELMTRPGGDYPKYGAVDRDYRGPEYDGFQDTFTSSLYANLEWGRFAQARAVLDGYFTQFVQDDGMVNMRGPETGQFGLTLYLVARYLRLTGDGETLRRHGGKIAATADILARLHQESLALPPSDPGHGLIHGWNESDSCLFPDPSVWWRPYFANSAFAVRGWRALAAVWPLLVPSEAARGQDWGDRARMLQARLIQSVRASVRSDLTPPYVPPLPGVRLTFRESLSREKPSPQQWPHRAYSELLQADVLAPDLAAQVVDTLRGHGGTSLGVVANVGPPSAEGRDILGFISYGYARALLKLDRIEAYLLFLYSHRYHAHTPGGWTAGEVCDIAGGLPLFCMPAQMTIPLLTRWMLAFEDDDAERLHLARAVPRMWLATGRPIGITRAPTRWGTVDLRLQADPAARRVTASVELYGRGRPEETWLRLRAPRAWGPARARVNGAAHPLSGDALDTLRLDSRARSGFEIVASYDRGPKESVAA